MENELATIGTGAKVAEKAAENMLNPPTKAVGDTLADIWGLVFGDRISHARQMKQIEYAAKLDQFKAELAEKITQIPPERRMLPNFQTVSQALDDSKYCVEEDDLRKMFVNLISSTMDQETSKAAHPSFSGIIKQMSSFDAQLFRAIYQFYHAKYIPMISPQLAISGTTQYVLGVFPAWVSGISLPGRDILQISSSYFSLQRFGLIDLMWGETLSEPSLHDFLYNHPDLVSIAKACEAEHPGKILRIETKNSTGHITDFGMDFARCCL